MLQLMTLIMLCFAFTGCTATSYQSNPSNEYYVDPSKTFRVKRLISPFNPVMNETCDATGAITAVTFQDDIGQLIRFERIADVRLKAIESLSEDDALNWTFEFMYDLINKQLPGTKVVEKQKVEVEPFGAVYVGILNIPQGSTMMDASTHERRDARRAFAIAFERDDLIVVSVQENQIISNGRTFLKREPTDKDNMTLMEGAIEALKSYQRLR